MEKVKIILSLFIILIVFLAISNIQGGKTNNVAVSIEESDKFTEEEMNKAVKTVKRKFVGLDGCEMTNLWYSEKESNAAIEEYLNSGDGLDSNLKKENIIVLFSDFNVDSSGEEEGFNPNSTYTDWKWILVRNSITNNWRVNDWGY